MAKAALGLWAGTALLLGAIVSIGSFLPFVLELVPVIAVAAAMLGGIGLLMLLVALALAKFRRKRTGLLRIHEQPLSLGLAPVQYGSPPVRAPMSAFVSCSTASPTGKPPTT